jgi:quercetin dioxygenase-like cupin family protein
MQKTSLTALMRHELEHARVAPAGRSSKTVYGGHEKVLRQTLIALRAGEGLDEHVSPGEATIHVLHGRVLLGSGGESWSGWVGDLLIVPSSSLTLKALEDSAVLLTVAKLIRQPAPEL